MSGIYQQLGPRTNNYGTPIPRTDVEAKTRNAPSDVNTYFLTPEELAIYRAMPAPKRKRPVAENGRAVKERDAQLIAKEEDPMSGKFTKEEYLQLRKYGLRRTEIVHKFEVHSQTFYAWLRNWGIADKKVEQSLLDALELDESVVKRLLPSVTQEVAATIEAKHEMAPETVEEIEQALAQSPYARLEALKPNPDTWFHLDTSNVEDATEKLRAFEEQVKRTIEALQTLREFFCEAVVK